MPTLSKALAAWGTPGFDAVLKEEVRQLGVEGLPLQEGLAQGSYTSGDNLQVSVIGAVETAHALEAKAGLFYTSILPGCACEGDPTPMSDLPEYCEVSIVIDKGSGEARIELLQDFSSSPPGA